MRMNNKAFFPGWQYIAGFFLVSIVLVFIIGMYDFTIVEVYEPIHNKLDESLIELGANESEVYTQFQENSVAVHNKDLPFNMIYIFVFFNSIIFSIINVARQNKQEPMELIFKTIGGMVFFLYLMQIIIFKIITYFKLEVVDYLFQDLILSYIPFYGTTFDNAGIIILIWGVTLIIVNWYFGKKKTDTSSFFS